MKSFLDFEEKNVEKAILKACEELNVPREKLKYDIISHGSSGIFGLVGAKKALIRVFIPDLPRHPSSTEAPSAVALDVAQPNAEAPSHRDTVTALVDEAFGETTDSGATAPAIKKPPKPRKHQKTEKKHNSESPKQLPKKQRPKAVETGDPPESSDSAIDPEPFSDPMPAEEISAAGPVETADPAAREAALAVAREMAEIIFKSMELTAEVSPKSDGEPFGLNVKVPEPGVLIDKRGQTLEAIQYLVDKVVSKQCGKGGRVIIDVEGYVETRKAELKDLATKLANKTLKSGKPSTMMRMNAHDRRIVHIALKRNPAVRTQSVGDGYYRKLIIFPKKKTRKKTENPHPAE